MSAAEASCTCTTTPPSYSKHRDIARTAASNLVEIPRSVRRCVRTRRESHKATSYGRYCHQLYGLLLVAPFFRSCSARARLRAGPAACHKNAPKMAAAGSALACAEDDPGIGVGNAEQQELHTYNFCRHENAVPLGTAPKHCTKGFTPQSRKSIAIQPPAFQDRWRSERCAGRGRTIGLD